MLHHIQQYWLDYAFSCVIAILGFICKSLNSKLQKLKKENNGVTNGVKALLHAEILRMGNSLISKGYCTADEFEEFEYLYRPYHDDLNGNGSGERMWEQVKRLPQKNPDEI